MDGNEGGCRHRRHLDRGLHAPVGDCSRAGRAALAGLLDQPAARLDDHRLDRGTRDVTSNPAFDRQQLGD